MRLRPEYIVVKTEEAYVLIRTAALPTFLRQIPITLVNQARCLNSIGLIRMGLKTCVFA